MAGTSPQLLQAGQDESTEHLDVFPQQDSIGNGGLVASQ